MNKGKLKNRAIFALLVTILTVSIGCLLITVIAAKPYLVMFFITGLSIAFLLFLLFLIVYGILYPDSRNYKEKK